MALKTVGKNSIRNATEAKLTITWANGNKAFALDRGQSVRFEHLPAGLMETPEVEDLVKRKKLELV